MMPPAGLACTHAGPAPLARWLPRRASVNRPAPFRSAVVISPLQQGTGNARAAGLVVHAASSSASSNVQLGTKAFESLKGKQVYLVSKQELVDITSLWSAEERVVLVFGRCARQLHLQD